LEAVFAVMANGMQDVRCGPASFHASPFVAVGSIFTFAIFDGNSMLFSLFSLWFNRGSWSCQIHALSMNKGVNGIELDDIRNIERSFSDTTLAVFNSVLSCTFYLLVAWAILEVVARFSCGIFDMCNFCIAGFERVASALHGYVYGFVKLGEWTNLAFSTAVFSDGGSVIIPCFDEISLVSARSMIVGGALIFCSILDSGNSL